jgi:hypothetical protein
MHLREGLMCFDTRELSTAGFHRLCGKVPFCDGHLVLLAKPVPAVAENEIPRLGMSVAGVRRDKAALSSGCKSHPATAPAGSNRSSYGGNEVAEAFG